MSNVSSERPTEATPPKRYPWSPLAAIIIVLGSFAVLPFIASAILAIIPGILRWDELQSQDWLTHSTTGNFLYVLFSEMLTIGVLIWFIRQRGASFTRTVALKRPKMRDVGYAIGGILAYFTLFIAVFTLADTFLPINTDQEQAIGFERGIHGIGLTLAFVSLVVLPPIAEEIIFRGFFYGTLRGHNVKMPMATFITSLLFGALHLFGATEGGLLWIALIDTFVLSLVLCYMREKTGSIWAGIGVHALKNGFVFLNLFILQMF